MTAVVMVFMMTVGGILQALLPSPTGLGGARFPVLLALVLYYALTRRMGPALSAALAAGLFEDSLGQVPLGYTSFCYAVTAGLVNRFRGEVYVEHWITHIVLGALVGGLVNVAVFGLLRVSGHLHGGWHNLFARFLGSMLLGGITVPPVFAGARRLNRMLGLHPPGKVV